MLLSEWSTARCSASHPRCETIWNTDVRQLYSNLTTGTLGGDELQTFCRLVFPPWHVFQTL